MVGISKELLIRLIKQILEHSTLCYYLMMGKIDIQELHIILEPGRRGSLGDEIGRALRRDGETRENIGIREEMGFSGPSLLAT